MWLRHDQCNKCKHCDVEVEEVGMNDNGYIFTEAHNYCILGYNCDSDDECEEMEE